MEQKEFIFPKHVHDQWESIYSPKYNFNLASNFQLTFLFIFKYLRDLSFQKFLS